jgi:hypothetical protein
VRRAVRAVLGHRGEHVGGREQPRATWKAGRSRTTVIAAPVQALVVCRSERSERGEHRRRGQHALGPVRMQPDPLAIGGAERAGSVPDGADNAGAADVVQQRREPEVVNLAESGQPRCLEGQLGDVRRVADQVEALEVRERRERSARPLEIGRGQRQHWRGLSGSDGDNKIVGRLDRGEDLLGAREEHLTQRWVQVAAGASVDLGARSGNAAEGVGDRRLFRDPDDPGDRVQRLAGTPAGQPAPSQRSNTSPNDSTTTAGRPSCVPSATATSHDARTATGPTVGATARNACIAGAPTTASNAASCTPATAWSPGSNVTRKRSNAMSSPNNAAFSLACPHPTARNKDARNAARWSGGSSSSARASPSATRHARSPRSNGNPVARSVVSDKAASTSTSLACSGSMLALSNHGHRRDRDHTPACDTGD